MSSPLTSLRGSVLSMIAGEIVGSRTRRAKMATEVESFIVVIVNLKLLESSLYLEIKHCNNTLGRQVLVCRVLQPSMRYQPARVAQASRGARKVDPDT